MAPAETLTVFLKLLAAGFYGVSSFLIVVVNKSVLTNYRWSGCRVTAEPRRAGTGVRAHQGMPSATLSAAPARTGGQGVHNEAGAQGLVTRRLTAPGPVRPHAHAPSPLSLGLRGRSLYVFVCVSPRFI